MGAILLTGASGFVGSALLLALKSKEYEVRPVFRGTLPFLADSDAVCVATLDGDTDWSLCLRNVDIVIHTAALTQSMTVNQLDAIADYRCVNVDATLNLARQAVEAGVRRFVFISSIKVNGESTQLGMPYRADDIPSPKDPYGISKEEAEIGLKALSQEFGLEVVIIRPPIVYGPGVKGNLSTLVGWISRGLPLPFGLVSKNRRSFVALDNLVDLILKCTYHPKAINQTFLVSDGNDLSTVQLMKKIGSALNKRICLLPIPVVILVFFFSVICKRQMSQRLLGSLQLDITKTCDLLNWTPPVTVDEGVRSMVKELK